jgi:hypothetical protein
MNHEPEQRYLINRTYDEIKSGILQASPVS